MGAPLPRRIPATALSGGLIGLALLWFASAWVFHDANRQSKDGVFGAPVWTLGALVLVPLATLLLVPWLIVARRSDGQRLHGLDYLALLAGAAPFAFAGARFVGIFLRAGG